MYISIYIYIYIHRQYTLTPLGYAGSCRRPQARFTGLYIYIYIYMYV